MDRPQSNSYQERSARPLYTAIGVLSGTWKPMIIQRRAHAPHGAKREETNGAGGREPAEHVQQEREAAVTAGEREACHDHQRRGPKTTAA